jgi:antibiotic biosynthesis monooxygenase (ABM) superfamily enzyme
MEKDEIQITGKDVTIVVSRTVFPGHEEEYGDWVRRLVRAGADAPGNTGVITLIPQKGKGGLHHVVMQFKDQASVDAWEASAMRAKLAAEADRFSRSNRQTATGLETWFSIPECPQLETPPHWKQAIVTFVGVYAVSALVIWVLGRFHLGWNFFLENILVSALVVAALTWAVMPLLTRLVFRKWLYRY